MYEQVLAGGRVSSTIIHCGIGSVVVDGVVRLIRRLHHSSVGLGSHSWGLVRQ